jgi:geranylgeranyl pyrophosphate synthase
MENMTAMLRPYVRRVEADMELWLADSAAPEALSDAMRYCVLGGGKRLRPALVLMSAAAVGGDAMEEMSRRSAVAIEMIHCYSLVHDDLPAMDDDVLRRGRPTAHVQFGEAMAVLAGDALLTRAFAVLSATAAADARAGRLVAELAMGAGEAGMIAGQVADMDLCDVPSGVEGLRFIHNRKTGALIRAACRMGAISGRASRIQLDALGRYGEQLGLAFQLVDDILDATGDRAVLGKTPGKDAQAGKRTYVSELGLEAARTLAQEVTAAAVAALEPLAPKAAGLAVLAKSLTGRTH